MNHKLPRLAFVLGFAGLLPQIAAATISLHPPHAALGQYAAFLYAALIYSFLGGLWWGIAAAAPTAPRWLFFVAVVPSLFAFVAGLMWIARSGSAANALTIVGAGLLSAPLIDADLKRRGLVPKGWMTLRIALSAGLGALTLVIAYWSRAELSGLV